MNKKYQLKNNVQKYRVWKNMLQKELAEAVNISISELRLIEKNSVCPRLQLRLRLCEYFGVSHDQMFYNNSSKNKINNK
jgi:putative transcriptional regulator